jgi:hypothetical protein
MPESNYFLVAFANKIHLVVIEDHDNDIKFLRSCNALPVMNQEIEITNIYFLSIDNFVYSIKNKGIIKGGTEWN